MFAPAANSSLSSNNIKPSCTALGLLCVRCCIWKQFNISQYTQPAVELGTQQALGACLLYGFVPLLTITCAKFALVLVFCFIILTINKS